MAAADFETSMDKHPVTPAPVVPARELLGDLLLELGQPGPALQEFEATLTAQPNRFRSLFGAARAAELAGDAAKARAFCRGSPPSAGRPTPSGRSSRAPGNIWPATDETRLTRRPSSRIGGGPAGRSSGIYSNVRIRIDHAAAFSHVSERDQRACEMGRRALPW